MASPADFDRPPTLGGNPWRQKTSVFLAENAKARLRPPEPEPVRSLGPVLVTAGVGLFLGATLGLLVGGLAEASAGAVVAVVGATLLATGLGVFAVVRWFWPAIERVRRELCQAREREIARYLRRSLRPRAQSLPGVELAAVSLPAEEIGGDYHDVIPGPEGTWFALGEVSGQGLTTSLITLLIQSVVGVLAGHRPGARPAELLQVIARVLVENVRRRLHGDQDVRLTLCHLAPTGVLTYAGANQELMVCRAASGRVECVQTSEPKTGPLGTVAMTDSTATLHPGDVVLICTDGAPATRSALGEFFGAARIAEALAAAHKEPAAVIGAAVVGAIMDFAPRTDAATMLVFRYTGT